MSLDKSDVARIATLARIAVADAELATLARQLDGILHWIEQLNEVDTAGIEPMASVTGLGLPRRPDAVTDGGHAEKILANAPETAHGFFVVPKVVE